MENILWFYILCIVGFTLFVIYSYTYKTIEGNTGKDKCEYVLNVPGMMDKGTAEVLKFLGLSFITDMINSIVIYVDFFANKFIGCLLFYLLDGIGKVLWGIVLGFFAIIFMPKLPLQIYNTLNDNADANLYHYTGMHFMHFPTIIQNRCYRVDGKNRIPCWQNPFNTDGKGEKEGISGVSNNATQGIIFFKLLRKVLFFLFILLCVYATFVKLSSWFVPSVKCEGSSCK